ncbi:hypothetical protein NCLIV_007520 [Neospora caninum Liverpool]|uniref:Peptidase c13 family protein n=1 Tax=Neospora caninum (strain Liverpool) TaxID=572307 RepID=F0V953_NEOCL|nr:hypothetical protein NCLIV_007520 [Neospora caninum Liverpool]CBZ50278.1 hypothetical protein NCLIV_007520 [Neospora caninum Liverpool]CEL64883.1 TPA: peptidase c13 family protein [Neospora caninum Liverpool]|eukprot:XP_003880312.1 hypothetical protein NCLIV_007520 [Neospora caninum Liverpool]
MLSDDHACSPRNFFPGRIFNDHSRNLNLYGAGDAQGEASTDSVEVDYRGDEVQVATLLQLLAGRHNPATPRGKRLLTDANSNVLLYLSGHGGDGFLKFQDWEEISSVDLADAVAQMKAQRRFRQMLLIAETCQGSTLLDAITTPGVLGLASSGPKESSYSHHADGFLGVAVIDRWTYYTLQFFEKSVKDSSSPATFQQLLDSYSRKQLMSTASARTELFDKSLADTKLTEFFAAASTLHATDSMYPLRPRAATTGKKEKGTGENEARVRRAGVSVGTYYARHFALVREEEGEMGEEEGARDRKQEERGRDHEGATTETVETLWEKWAPHGDVHPAAVAGLILLAMGTAGATSVLL